MSDAAERFPRPWRLVEGKEAFWVEDAAGKRFGYCYFSETVHVGTGRDERLTREGARRLASNFAKLGKE